MRPLIFVRAFCFLLGFLLLLLAMGGGWMTYLSVREWNVARTIPGGIEELVETDFGKVTFTQSVVLYGGSSLLLLLASGAACWGALSFDRSSSEPSHDESSV